MFLIILGTNLYAKDGDEVCFTQDQALSIAVELKTGQLNANLVVKYEAKIAEQDSQIKATEEKVTVLSEKVDESLKQIELNKKIADDKDEARLQEIKDLKKPKWSSMFGSFGLGAVVAGILALVL